MIYVDKASNYWRGRWWCHLFADSNDELHVFAARLGLRRDWFQADNRLPHYDVTESKRARAIRLGAIEVDRHFVYKRILINCGKRSACKRKAR